MLLLKGGPTLGPRCVILYSPIKLLEFSCQPIRRSYLDSCCCCIPKSVGELELSQQQLISFIFTEKDYCLKGIYLVINVSRKHHSLY